MLLGEHADLRPAGPVQREPHRADLAPGGGRDVHARHVVGEEARVVLAACVLPVRVRRQGRPAQDGARCGEGEAKRRESGRQRQRSGRRDLHPREAPPAGERAAFPEGRRECGMARGDQEEARASGRQRGPVHARRDAIGREVERGHGVLGRPIEGERRQPRGVIGRDGAVRAHLVAPRRQGQPHRPAAGSQVARERDDRAVQTPKGQAADQGRQPGQGTDQHAQLGVHLLELQDARGVAVRSVRLRLGRGLAALLAQRAEEPRERPGKAALEPFAPVGRIGSWASARWRADVGLSTRLVRRTVRDSRAIAQLRNRAWVRHRVVGHPVLAIRRRVGVALTALQDQREGVARSSLPPHHAALLPDPRPKRGGVRRVSSDPHPPRVSRRGERVDGDPVGLLVRSEHEHPAWLLPPRLQAEQLPHSRRGLEARRCAEVARVDRDQVGADDMFQQVRCV